MGKYIPFNKDELKVVGHFPVVPTDTYAVQDVLVEKLNTPITPRENFERFFNRKNPLWVPDIMTDLNYLYPAVIPDSIACSWSGGLDAFGCKWIPDESCPELPAFPEPGNIMLKDIADWRELEWPDPTKWNWELSREEHKVVDKDRPNAIFLFSSLFERMITLMGFENAAMAFLEDPDSTHDFIDRLEEYNILLIEHAHKYLDGEIIIFSDDWGSQNSPFFSIGIAEEFFAPHISALTKRAHELGMRFMHHCCGNSTAFVPLMIDEGVDWWEFDYGAVHGEIEEIIKKYGDKILFDGYPGFSIPMPEDDEEFKIKTIEHYKHLAGNGNCSLSIIDNM